MSVDSRLLIAAIVVLGISTSANAKPITLTAIDGQWRVYKSGLADPEGVQAYGDEQLRAIVGNKLVISRDGIRWIISHGQNSLREYESFRERCSEPVIRDKGRGRFDILCSGGDVFAPGFSKQRNGDLVVGWWDGLMLYLRKQK